MMAKAIYKKVMFVGRATTFTVALVVILALTVGLASTTLAGTGIGAAFNLGQTNTVNAISKLVGSAGGPSLLLDNNSTSRRATALELQVEAGRPPMQVNSGTKVTNLNSDALDGKDSSQYVPKATYDADNSATVPPKTTVAIVVSCDPGDVALSGGFGFLDVSSNVLESHGIHPADEDWRIRVFNGASFDDSVTAMAHCADYGVPYQ